MRTLLSLLLMASLILSCSAAMAKDGMDVQVIGGPEADAEPVSLDDIKLNAAAEAEGQFTFKATSFEYVDYLLYYRGGITDTHPVYDRDSQYNSGLEADYAILRADILNEKRNDVDFLKDCNVIVTYDGSYQYGGWAYQYNYDNGDYANCGGGDVRVIDPKDNFAIGPMYEGHYAFGCTLPNSIVSSKKPLSMTITLGGNEITYNIRK